ncbi:MAG: hypothetical protein IE914_10545 [Thiotrichales bacterium]|nr:hypothetical protein [Thiotrichales bacterium]
MEVEFKDGKYFFKGKEVPKAFIDQVREEVKKWYGFLNNVLGVTAFLTGLACVSTENPQFWASISVVFMLFLLWTNIKMYPPTISSLRDDYVALYKLLRKKEIKVFHMVTRLPLYTFGMCFLGFVMIYLNHDLYQKINSIILLQ